MLSIDLKARIWNFHQSSFSVKFLSSKQKKKQAKFQFKMPRRAKAFAPHPGGCGAAPYAAL